MSATATATPTLSARHAQALADADGRVAAAKAKLDDAVGDRDFLRNQARTKLPDGKAITVGGVTVKRTESSSESFSLKRYRDSGLKVTAAMRRFVTVSDRETWTVKRG